MPSAARVPLVLLLLTLGVWGLAFFYIGFHTLSARDLSARAAAAERRSVVLVAQTCRALLAERYPFAIQAPAERFRLFWRNETVPALDQTLAQLSFLRNFADSSRARIVWLNVPVLLPVLLTAFGVVIWWIRTTRYALPGIARGVKQLCLSLPLFMVLEGVGLVTVMLTTAPPAGLRLHRVLVAVQTLELGAAWLAALGVTGVILMGEVGLFRRAWSNSGPAPRWMQGALFGGGVAVVTLVALAVAGANWRLESSIALGKERLAAENELARLRTVTAVGSGSSGSSNYLSGLFTLEPLLSGTARLRSEITAMRSEIDRLRLAEARAAFAAACRPAQQSVSSLIERVNRLEFAWQEKPKAAEIGGAFRSLMDSNVPTLDEAASRHAALQQLMGRAAALSREIDMVVAAYGGFVTEWQQVLRTAEQMDSLLRRHEAGQLDVASVREMASAARKTGPPFEPLLGQLRDHLGVMRDSVGALARKRADVLLARSELSATRALLQELTDKFSLRLPDQLTELERREEEHEIALRCEELVGRWVMAEGDSGLTKNYAVTRTLTITRGRRPHELVVAVTYVNDFKDGMFAKKKRIERSWVVESVMVRPDGARLNMPDYRFSYDEANRRESQWSDVLLRVRVEELEVREGNGVRYRFRRMD